MSDTDNALLNNWLLKKQSIDSEALDMFRKNRIKTLDFYQREYWGFYFEGRQHELTETEREIIEQIKAQSDEFGRLKEYIRTASRDELSRLYDNERK